MPDQSLLGSLNPRGDLAEYKRRKAYDAYDAELQLPQGQMGGGGQMPQPAPMPDESQLTQLDGGVTENKAANKRKMRMEQRRREKIRQKRIEELSNVAEEFKQAKIVGVGGGAAGENFYPLTNLAPQTRDALIDFMRDEQGNKVPVSGFNLSQLSPKARFYLQQLQLQGERQSPNNRFETQGQ